MRSRKQQTVDFVRHATLQGAPPPPAHLATHLASRRRLWLLLLLLRRCRFCRGRSLCSRQHGLGRGLGGRTDGHIAAAGGRRRRRLGAAADLGSARRSVLRRGICGLIAGRGRRRAAARLLLLPLAPERCQGAMAIAGRRLVLCDGLEHRRTPRSGRRASAGLQLKLADLPERCSTRCGRWVMPAGTSRGD